MKPYRAPDSAYALVQPDQAGNVFASTFTGLTTGADYTVRVSGFNDSLVDVVLSTVTVRPTAVWEPPANCVTDLGTVGSSSARPGVWKAECTSLAGLANNSLYYTFTVATKKAYYITAESCAGTDLTLWRGTSVNDYDYDWRRFPDMIAANGGWSGGSLTNDKAVSRIERTMFTLERNIVSNNRVTANKETVTVDNRLEPGTYTIEVGTRWYTQLVGFYLSVRTWDATTPNASYCSNISTGLYPQTVWGDIWPPAPPTPNRVYWLDQHGNEFRATEYDHSLPQPDRPSGSTGESGPSGSSGEPGEPAQGPAARPIGGCFTDLGPLNRDQLWGGEWFWDPAHRLFSSGGYALSDICNAHHRAERPARYLHFSLAQQTRVELTLEALEPHATAALYISNDTPRSGWGVAPANSYANRVATRSSKGKLVHHAAPSVSLLLPAGNYTLEAVADSTNADSFELAIDVQSDPDDTVTPPVADPDSAPTVTETVHSRKLKTHYANVGEAFSVVLPAADADSGNGGPYVYELLNRADNSAFGANGLSFDAAKRTLSGTPAAELTHELTYRVHDADSNRAATDAFIDAANLRIVVIAGGGGIGQSNSDTSGSDPQQPLNQPVNEPVNRAPSFDAGVVTSLSVPENSPAGTKVGSPITASDPDGDTLAYSLTGNDHASFAIDATGQITTVSGVTYDYETKSSYSVAVNAADGQGLSVGTPVTITLTDVSEPSPPTAKAGADFNVKRGESVTLNGSGTAHAEGSQTLSYQWTVSGASKTELATVAAGSSFLSNATQAQAGFTMMKRMHMSDRSTLDNDNWIEFTLTVTDGDGESHSDTVRVTIEGSTWVAFQ